MFSQLFHVCVKKKGKKELKSHLFRKRGQFSAGCVGYVTYMFVRIGLLAYGVSPPQADLIKIVIHTSS